MVNRMPASFLHPVPDRERILKTLRMTIKTQALLLKHKLLSLHDDETISELLSGDEHKKKTRLKIKSTEGEIVEAGS